MMKGLLKFVMAAAVMAVCTVSVKAQDYTILAAKLPQKDGVKVQIGADKSAMELLQTGWWFVELDAYAEDSVTFVGYDVQDNEYLLAEYDDLLGAWVEVSFALGDKWEDDSYKGVPCKWIEIDFSDTEVFAWKPESEVIPAKVTPVAAAEPKKAIKVFEDGVLYIIKDGVKYDMLGVAQ
jgi:hypothetical protein